MSLASAYNRCLQAAQTHQSQATASDSERSTTSSVITYYGLPFDSLLSRSHSDGPAQKQHSELDPTISSDIPTANTTITTSTSSCQEPSAVLKETAAVKPIPAASVPVAGSATAGLPSKCSSVTQMLPPPVSSAISQ